MKTIPGIVKGAGGGGGGGDSFRRYSERANIMMNFEDFCGSHSDPANLDAFGGAGGLFSDSEDNIAPLNQIGGWIRGAAGRNKFSTNNNACLGNTNLGDIGEALWGARIATRPTNINNYAGYGIARDNFDEFYGVVAKNSGNFRYLCVVATAIRADLDSGVAYDGSTHEFYTQIEHDGITFRIDGAAEQKYILNPGTDWLQQIHYPGAICSDTGGGILDIDYVYYAQTGNPRE